MTAIRKYTFGKEERLKSSIQIARLFASGYSVTKFPFKVFWDFTVTDDQNVPVRTAISVPKKNFKKAVDRNLIKRRLREAYRKNKFIIYEALAEKNIKINLVILYLPDKILESDEIQAGYTRLFRELTLAINRNYE